MMISHRPTAAEAKGIGSGRRWAMLAISTLAQSGAAVMAHGAAFLIPTLVAREGLTLTQAGLIAAAPTIGVMLALVAWGALTDAVGERLVLQIGLSVAAAAGLAAVLSSNLVLFALALGVGGAASASSNVASGRVVVGWFPAHRRGLAMGIRQMAQPVGVGIAAITISVTAERHGIHAALWIPTIACAVTALAVSLVIQDPPRPTRTVTRADNPYRGNRYLARIHAVSVLLVVPQFLVWTFALVWLVQDRDWSAAAAGTLVAVAQVFGAVGRILVGQLSDVVRSRMRPLRWVGIAAAVVLLAMGLAAGEGWWVAVPLMVLATVLTVADNGLAFTAVAERAGPFWSGRALAIQNTAQFLTSSLVPPLGGAVIVALGFPRTFALAALFPALALALVPVRDEHELS